MAETPQATPELQQYIDKCVRLALNRYRRQAASGFVVLLLGIALAFFVEQDHNSAQRDQIIDQGKAAQKSIVASGDAIAVSGCNRDFTTIDNLRGELERSLLRIDLLEKDGTYSARQAQVARQSTREFLEKYTLPDCRKADDVLTANPGKPVTVPAPRYADDPQQLEEQRQARTKLGGQDLRNK